MTVKEKRDIKRKLNVINYAKKTGDVNKACWHYESLYNARTSLEDVVKSLESGIIGDLLAMHIRQALLNLGEITGEISPEI
jgi:tRNA U34 5-carboxymethylaminomethyl modifying GTPase MnmE/TrmE